MGKRTSRNLNLSIQPELVEEFSYYAEKLGIKISPWVTAQMKEFVEDQKMIEEQKKKKSS